MLQLLLLVAATSAQNCELKPVLDLETTVEASSGILASWSAPSPADVQCVRGYRICSMPYNSSTVCTDVQDANITWHVFTRLQGCTQYNISVMVLGENNATSQPVSAIASTAPVLVTSLDVSRRDNDTVTVLWNYDLSGERACATRFQISLCNLRQTNCSSTNVTATGTSTNVTATGSSTNVTATGSQYSLDLQRSLTCNAYYVTAVVFDSKEQSSSSIRLTGDPDIRGVPENLTVTNYTSSSFALEWAIPASQVNCEYFASVFIISKVGNHEYSYKATCDPGTFTHSAKVTTSCTAYNVSVTFRSTDGADSATTMAYTLPDGDRIFNNATVQDATPSSVTVAWKTSLPVDQCIAAYSVCWTTQNSTGEACRNTTNEENSLQITGLAANTTYQVSVSALLHTGTQFDHVIVDASTKSAAAGILRSSLVGVSTVIYCLVTLHLTPQN